MCGPIHFAHKNLSAYTNRPIYGAFVLKYYTEYHSIFRNVDWTAVISENSRNSLF